jgi:thiamine biosynthesis lipoprotein
MVNTKRLLPLLLLLLAFGGFVVFVILPTPSSFPPSSLEFYALGTFIRLQAWGKQAPKALAEAQKAVEDVERRFSRFNPLSEAGMLEQKAGKEEHPFSEESLFLFSKALEYAQRTEGAFDPTLGALTRLWGIGTPEERIPSEEEIQEALKAVGYKDLHLFPERGTAMLARKGQIPDFGGIAKGYAGDRVRDILKSHGISQGLINMGGNITVLGNKPGGAPWKIGIQNPLEPRGAFLGILSLAEISVVTSGNYERYFEEEGIRYHHILDPRTGHPASQELLSVTVICKDALEGDALATGLYVLGLSQGIKLAENLEGVEALFVTSDRRVLGTSGIPEIFMLTQESFTFETGR